MNALTTASAVASDQIKELRKWRLKEAAQGKYEGRIKI